MKTDTFIEIGSQHQMCEDYIISGDNYIILADGCSSSKHSEMGARFLCYMTRQFMKSYGSRLEPLESSFPDSMGTWIIHNAEMLSRQLGLNKTCLDATLIVAYLKDNMVHVNMFGDGYLVIKTRWAGIYDIYCVDYKAGSKSMPFYLRYQIDKEGRDMYHSAKVTKTVTKTTIWDNGKVEKHEPVETAYDHVESKHIPINGFESLSICSDGLGTFLRPVPDETGNKIMNAEDMIPYIFDFKSSTGVFLQREMNICKRQLKKIDLKFEHFDDLSIGTFLKEKKSDAKKSEVE